jgi:hypothetical protein
MISGETKSIGFADRPVAQRMRCLPSRADGQEAPPRERRRKKLGRWVDRKVETAIRWTLRKIDRGIHKIAA